MDAKLTLEKAKWEVRKKEAVKGNQQQLTSEPGHRPETLYTCMHVYIYFSL